MSQPICLATACGQLRVRFFVDGDRFAHAIEGKVGDTYAPVLRSVEGTADEAWPPSSPLQDVRHFDERNCLLGTGMAGRSFWSLSVTQLGDALVFDHACRPPSAVTPAAMTTYAATGALSLRDDGAIELGSAVRLLVVPAATSSSEPPVIEIRDHQLRVLPAPHNTPRSKQVRWAMQIAVQKPLV